jgi:hypothetical protein
MPACLEATPAALQIDFRGVTSREKIRIVSVGTPAACA